jgi:hypothetical protein
MLLVTGAAAGQESAAPAVRPCSLRQLARWDWHRLEELYRQSDAGPVPVGFARGRAIYPPDRPLHGLNAVTTRLLWRGKDFDPDGGALVNRWLGFEAIRARVYLGPSWLDGKPSIVMDYCGTSRVWRDVRDELREVAPGLYLGIMYRRRCPRPQFRMFFALEATGCR